MTSLFPSSDRRHERGFSLIELIVVLAILSIVAVAVAPLATPWRRGTLIDVAAREVVLGLRAARAAAIYGNKETVFTLDGAAGHYWSDGAPAPKTLPGRITAAFAPGTSLGRIRFFPDGGASGGTIVLRDTYRSASIRIDALSGRATFDVGR
jgi:general secretion pathway protein H